MTGCGRRLLFLGVVALLLLAGSGSSPSHSLRNCYTGVSEPIPGLPQFTAVGYMDDQLITWYDSQTWKTKLVPAWMNKAQADPTYLAEADQDLQKTERKFRESLVTLQDHFHQNSSTGLHTLQHIHECKLGPGRGGSWKYAYDGKDLLFLNTETSNWTVFVPQDEILKKKLNNLLGDPHQRKHYLDNICMQWLGMYLGYGKETLQRTEPPKMRVAGKKGSDGQETLICQLYGFYPKETEVTWMKDGEDQKSHTEGVFPNTDGTYYTSLSIKVEPKERNRYRCQVGNNSVPVPSDQAGEGPASNLGLILGISMIVLAVVILLMAGVTIYLKKRRPEGGYTSASRESDQEPDKGSSGDSIQGSDCSTQNLVLEETTGNLPNSTAV